MTSAVQLAKQFANAVSKEYNVPMQSGADYGIKVMNKTQSNEHGYCYNALATICYEGLGDAMIELADTKEWINRARAYGFYFEPYASWLIAIYEIPSTRR